MTDAATSAGDLPVLFEDNHVLIVDKPAGLATMGALPGVDTACERARRYIRRVYAKPGNVYLGVVSRLDSLVTGVLPLARTSKAAARLSASFAEGRARKTYLALVAGDRLPESERLENQIAHDDRAQRMYCTRQAGRGQLAQLEYRVLARSGTWQLLVVDLLTGRKHQIRVQLAARGCPILGDRKYGSHEEFPAGIGLHARRLIVPHPVQAEPIDVAAPLPGSWLQVIDRDTRTVVQEQT